MHRTTTHERYCDLQEKRHLFQSGFIFRWKLFDGCSKYDEYCILKNIECVHNSNGCYVTRMIPSYSKYQPPVCFIPVILLFSSNKSKFYEFLQLLALESKYKFYKHAVEFKVPTPEFLSGDDTKARDATSSWKQYLKNGVHFPLVNRTSFIKKGERNSNITTITTYTFMALYSVSYDIFQMCKWKLQSCKYCYARSYIPHRSFQ